MSADVANTAATIAVVVAFALLATVHAATLFGLGARREGRRLLASLLLPVLAPYFAYGSGMRVRAFLWLAAGACYAAAFVIAS